MGCQIRENQAWLCHRRPYPSVFRAVLQTHVDQSSRAFSLVHLLKQERLQEASCLYPITEENLVDSGERSEPLIPQIRVVTP